MHCQERSEDRRRGRAVSFKTVQTLYTSSRVWSQRFSFVFSDTCQTQSMWGQAINRDLQGVNAKWVSLSLREECF